MTSHRRLLHSKAVCHIQCVEDSSELQLRITAGLLHVWDLTLGIPVLVNESPHITSSLKGVALVNFLYSITPTTPTPLVQCRGYGAWLLLGWVTAERSCLCKQHSCQVIAGCSEVIFKLFVGGDFLALTSNSEKWRAAKGVKLLETRIYQMPGDSRRVESSVAKRPHDRFLAKISQNYQTTFLSSNKLTPSPHQPQVLSVECSNCWSIYPSIEKHSNSVVPASRFFSKLQNGGALPMPLPVLPDTSATDELTRRFTSFADCECVVCTRNGLRKETIYVCETCTARPNLHPDTCFKTYHTLTLS
ncbi:hypothetical protein J6590_083480 [Homalodisca vitripennis]|nr:hypothetical protein J6590_083480 [Homalodisca vitripennis]